MSLEVEVRHRQGAFALDVAFRSEGRLTALFGRSGSGKTTLVNAIAGLVRPSEGRIAVDGTVLLATGARVFVPKHRRRMGYVFQEGRLLPHLTVRQNMLLGRWLAERQGGTVAGAAEVDRVVEMLGVGPLLSRRRSSRGLEGRSQTASPSPALRLRPAQDPGVLARTSTRAAANGEPWHKIRTNYRFHGRRTHDTTQRDRRCASELAAPAGMRGRAP